LVVGLKIIEAEAKTAQQQKKGVVLSGLVVGGAI
jgi:hypothetical protein